MSQFDHGFDEAIRRVLCHLEFRRIAYKANEEMAKYKAIDLLYKEIVQIFQSHLNTSDGEL